MARVESMVDSSASRKFGPTPRDWSLGGIVLFVVLLNFLTMPAEEYPGYPGDADTVRAETVTLLNTGNWAVPPEIARVHGVRGQYLYQNASGNYYPKYGVLNTLMYLPPLWLEKVAKGGLEVHSASRVLFLNILNVVLSGVTALYLVLLARRYTKSIAVVTIFVLASIYSTFWWSYLRAQTFEVYHTLFLLAFYFHFVSAVDGKGASKSKRASSMHFFGAASFLGALCLCKTAYVVLLPAIVLFLARGTMSILPGERKDRLVQQFLFFWLPVGILLSVLAATNWYKFDSPFATGYTQWEQERQLFKPSNLFPAIWGYLFAPRQSTFLHFPLLFFALAAWPVFFRKMRSDAVVVVLFALPLLLVGSMFVNWTGQACYGPRYLLPVLPLVALPFIEYIKWLRGLPRMAKSVLATATGAVLACSMMLQLCLNALPFFFCYDLRDVLDDKYQSAPAHYLRSRQFGAIDRDFILYRMGRASAFTTQFLDQLNSNELQRMSALNYSTRSNYYWFPDLLDRFGSRSAEDGISLQ